MRRFAVWLACVFVSCDPTACQLTSKYVRRHGKTSLYTEIGRRTDRGKASGQVGSSGSVSVDEGKPKGQALANDKAQELLEIDDICKRLSIDSRGCSRVKAYLGETLVDLQAPLHLKAMVNHDRFRVYRGDVTTKNGLAHASTKNQELATDYASLFSHIPQNIARDFPFLIAADDWEFTTRFRYPTVTRMSHVPDHDGNHVIGRMLRRWFEDAVEILPRIDIPFEKKSDSLVWRGSWTGAHERCNSGGYAGVYPNQSRMLLAERYANISDPRIDVGFSYGQFASVLEQGVHLPKGFSKTKLDMKSQLQHKFIMVVNGNGEATAMEWVMASNSVPFMARPNVQTWALHSWLEPWKHYVPVEPDFSDVQAKLEWAVAHPALSALIAEEGKKFMKEFEDKHRENRINAAVLIAYANRVKIEHSAEEANDFWQFVSEQDRPCCCQ